MRMKIPHIDSGYRMLADRLKADSIETMVDAYDPRPREGWLKWMEKHTHGLTTS